ncbi:thioredoxin family protein [Lacunimicrobium album]
MKNISLPVSASIVSTLLKRSCTIAMVVAMSVSPAYLPAQTEVPPEAKVESPDDAKPVPPEVKHVAWTSDLAAAQLEAKNSGKDLLLFFTGSDWCTYCIKLEKAVLLQPDAADRIAEHYVPVVLDFPRNSDMSEELKAQNDKLKSALGIGGFPTICVADVDLMTYGRIVGFREKDAFWTTFDEVTSAGDEIAVVKDGKSVCEIEDVGQLNELLHTVPSDQLKFGWLEQIKRLVEKSKGVNDDVSTAWASRLGELELQLEDERFVSDFGRKYMQARSDAKAPEDVLAFLDQLAEEVKDRPTRKSLVVSIKARYLSDIKRYDDAIALADEIINSEESQPRDKAMMNMLKQRIATIKERGEPTGVPMIRMQQ